MTVTGGTEAVDIGKETISEVEHFSRCNSDSHFVYWLWTEKYWRTRWWCDATSKISLGGVGEVISGCVEDEHDAGGDDADVGVADEHVSGGPHLCEERGEDLLVAAHVDASIQPLHLLLVFCQRVLEGITLDIQVHVLCFPGDRAETD